MAHMEGERWNVSFTWDIFFRFIHVENAQQEMSAPRWKTNTLEAEMLSLEDGDNFEHERYYNMEQRAQNLCTEHIAHRECGCRYVMKNFQSIAFQRRVALGIRNGLLNQHH